MTAGRIRCRRCYRDRIGRADGLRAQRQVGADLAGQVIFLKRSMRPGFAGIENELLFAERTQVLFGDAKESLSAVLAGLASV